VIFAAGGLTGQGALRAAAEAQVNAIGAERNQAAVLAGSGSSVATSIWGNAGFEVQNLIRLIRDENFNRAVNGQIKYAPLDQKFPQSLIQELDGLIQGLLSGEIRTGVAFEKP
jgi:basic membrane lipoprotein Med (substrate-binding protein (PBP1-ABC) superfamily)